MCKNGHDSNLLYDNPIDVKVKEIFISSICVQVCKRQKPSNVSRLGIEHASKSHNTP